MSSSDFIIVGGGVYGCAVAYHLAKQGQTVTLLEQRSIANAASGGSGKRGIRANKRDLRELPLVSEAYRLWPRLADEIGGATGYENTGGVYLIEDEMAGLSGGMIAAEHRARVQTALGATTELWSSEQLRKLLPGLSPKICAGLYTPFDSIASQSDTTHSYARAAQHYGASIVEGTQVTQLKTDTSGRITTAIDSYGHEHTAKTAMLIANNAGMADLVKDSLGVRLPVWPVYPQALAVRAQRTPSIPVLVGHDRRKLSVKMVGNDVIMLTGGWRGKFNSKMSTVDTIEDNIRGNLAELQAVFPDLGELTIEATYVDRPEAVSIDEIPLIGKLREGLYLAAGWSAHGWALAPSASQHIARMMLDDTIHTSIAPFGLDRFDSLLSS